MKKLIKLCGFLDESSLRELAALDVDMAGFILAPSKRQVQPERLKELAEYVPAGIKKVGVFVNPVMEELEHVMRLAPLDVIQLHGRETADFCREAKRRFETEIMKVMHIKGNQDSPLPDEAWAEHIDYLLLDTQDGAEAGGTGKSFRWDVIPSYHEWCRERHIPLLIAGGLTRENVTDLLDGWPLEGIDVSSGIETNGKKDAEKMRQLVERVRGHGKSAQ